MDASSRSDTALRIKASESIARRWFWCFVSGHLLLWTLVPVFANCNAPLDCIEMLYWGQEWQWGYYKHPPLPAWCCQIGRVLLGNADWPLYLASQLCVVTCFWAAWKMARQCMGAWPAFGAAVIIEACYYFNFTTPEINNNMLAKACWAVAVLMLYFSIQTNQKRYWVGTGISLGLAALAKYDVALLAISMLGFSIIHPRGRQCWRMPGPYLMLLSAGICFAPHLVWLVKSNFQTIEYFRGRASGAPDIAAHILRPLQFAGTQLVALGLVFLLATGVLGWRWRWRGQDFGADERLIRDYLCAVVLGPALLAMLYSLVAGAKLHSMWGSSMWTYIGVLLFVTFKTNAVPADYQKLSRRAFALSIVFALLLISKLTFIAEYMNRPSRTHFPGRSLAREVEARWDRITDAPMTLVGGDWWLAGNVAFYSGVGASVYPELRSDWAPWTSDQELRERGGVLLWPADDTSQSALSIPTAWADAFPEAEIQSPITLAWQRLPNATPVRIGMAVILPSKQSLLIAKSHHNADHSRGPIARW